MHELIGFYSSKGEKINPSRKNREKSSLSLFRASAVDEGEDMLGFLEALREQIPGFRLGSTLELRGRKLRGIPVGMNDSSVISGGESPYGFVNMGTSLHLQHYLPDVIVEQELRPYFGKRNMLVWSQVHDETIGQALERLSSRLQGGVSRNDLGWPVYGVVIPDVTVDKVRSLYEGDLSLISQEFSEIERARALAVKRADKKSSRRGLLRRLLFD